MQGRRVFRAEVQLVVWGNCGESQSGLSSFAWGKCVESRLILLAEE